MTAEPQHPGLTVAQARDALSDPVSRTALKAALRMEQQIAGKGWEQPPWLGTMIRSLGARVPDSTIGVVELSGMPLPFDDDETITLTLQIMAEALRTGPEPMDGLPSIEGSISAWLLVYETSTEPAVRVVQIIDRTGQLLMLTRQRGRNLRVFLEGDGTKQDLTDALREVMRSTPVETASTYYDRAGQPIHIGAWTG